MRRSSLPAPHPFFCILLGACMMHDPQMSTRNVTASNNLHALGRCRTLSPLTHVKERPLYCGLRKRSHVQCMPSDSAEDITAVPSTADTTQQQAAAEDTIHECVQELGHQVFTFPTSNASMTIRSCNLYNRTTCVDGISTTANI